MAIETSDNFLHKLKPPHLLHLHTLIVLHRPINFIRRTLARLFKPRHTHPELPEEIIPHNFEEVAKHYQQHGWAYIENVFHPDFHRELLREWPRNIFLKSPKTITKGYNIGFHWERNKPEPEYIEYFPAFEKLLSHLRSPEWAERIQRVVQSRHPLSCYSFMINASYPGSSVIPHRDSQFPSEALPYINVIFFVDGNDGGLALSHDNELNDVFFKPPSLKNTCLIYNITANFFHGFEPIKWGKFRHAITSSFCREGYLHKNQEA